MSVDERDRRLRSAVTKVVRPGTPSAETLDADDDAYGDRIPVDERLAFAFELSTAGHALAGPEALNPHARRGPSRE